MKSKLPTVLSFPLLADGAWGTELMNRKHAAGKAVEAFNLDSPEIVASLATDYINSGADIILTNSFQSARFQLERHGLSDRVYEINLLAAEISVRARNKTVAPDDEISQRTLVAGSIGPSGKLILTGDVTADELESAFREQAEALAAGGADWILIESMTDLEEMMCGVRGALEATGLPIVSSMVYDPVKTGGFRTIMGNTPSACAEAALEAGASIIGANCGTGIENYIDLAAELCSLDVAPVWIKPNRGMPEVVDGKTFYRQSAEEFARHSRKLLDVGVAIVGGCCGTTPEFIRSLRPIVDEFKAKSGGNPQ